MISSAPSHQAQIPTPPIFGSVGASHFAMHQGVN
jgi:hypothetical protein